MLCRTLLGVDFYSQTIPEHYEIGARAKYRERLMIKRTAAVALDRKSRFKSTCEQWLR